MTFYNKKPVVLLTGYLGAGKTTVLNELLKNAQDKNIALIVNDMGAINIDASLLKKSENSSVFQQMYLLELTNGCICCTLRDEFMNQIEQLATNNQVDLILVEASGISNPASVAEAFEMYEEANQAPKTYLSRIATVVDADRIYYEFIEDLQKIVKAPQNNDNDDPDIINLVMDQIEFCNVIVLNKCDLLDRARLEAVKDLLRKLQPGAELVETSYGKFDASGLFCGEVFAYDTVAASSLMGKAMVGESEQNQGDVNREHAHEELGISSFVYEDRRPFDYDRFLHFVENDYPESIIRAKGYIWFADDDVHVQLFEQAGRNSSISEISNWTASFSEAEQKEVFENYPDVLEDWDPVYGDRMNQLVLIGRNYNKSDIIAQLEGCIK
jgi:G3E family GTPase